MDKKRAAGIFLLISSSVLSLTQLTITGAAIGGVPFLSYFSLISIGTFILGTVFLLGVSLEQRLIREKGIVSHKK
tara:strand:- start:6561 stop:6785 length:225 start_codon:yes stop_codon:yes gene_type:complete